MKLLKCRYPICRAIWSKKVSYARGRKVGVGVVMLDHEWIELVKQAKSAGLTKEEVRQFLLEKMERKELHLSVLEKVK